MADASARVPLVRTDKAADLATAFAARLKGVEGLRRVFAAWTLARDTLEGTLEARKVEEGACRKGCAWCCRLEVRVSFAEAAHLARRASADPALEARLRATVARTKGLSEVARFRAAIPCAFLDQASGACSVYEDRPLACRSYRSRDADWCRSVVGTDGGTVAANQAPVIRQALGIRGLVQGALDEVTPPAWRIKGELHALTARVLDGVGRGAGPEGAAPRPLTPRSPVP